MQANSLEQTAWALDFHEFEVDENIVNDLIYRQSFYTIKLVGGYRFPIKENKHSEFLERIKL